MSRWKWRASTGWFSTCTYRNLAQHSSFLGLCVLVDHPPPAALDPENQFFTFEAGVAKLGGGNGWADVWFKGHFAIEYKGPNKSLAAAYEQLLQYRESLENPPLLITGNTQEFCIHTNFTNSAKQVVHLTIVANLDMEQMCMKRGCSGCHSIGRFVQLRHVKPHEQP